MGRRQRWRRIPSGFQDQQIEDEPMYYSQSTPTTSHKRQRTATSYSCDAQRCFSPPDPDLFDNRFSPDPEQERRLEELEEENRTLRSQIDEGEKLMQQSKQEKANLKREIADLEQKLHDSKDRVLELKQQRQMAEEKVKEEVAENKFLQGEKSRLISERSHQKPEMQNILNDRNDCNDALKRAIEDNKQKTAELENTKKELETIRKALHKGAREQQYKHEHSMRELNKAREEVESLRKELILTQKQVIREQGVGKDLELKFQKLYQRNETAHVFEQLRQGEARDTATNGAPAVLPSESNAKANVNKRLSDHQANAGELPLCPNTMEKPEGAQATMSLEQKHNKLKIMYSDMEGRLKHYEGLEERLKESEEKVKCYQRLEESRSKEQEMSVKDAVRSKELQVDLNRMCSEKQILSTKLAALEKDFENNQNILRDAQESLKQYKDHFGNQTPSEVSSQYQMKTKELKEATDKCQTLQDQLTSHQKELEDHKSQLDALMKVKIEETSELSELRIQNDNLHEKLTHWHQQFCDKNEQVAKQQQELDELHRQLGNGKEMVNNIHPKAQPEANPAM